MSKVIQAKPADSPGFTHITVDEAIGNKQASVLVKAVAGEDEQELHLCGQREFDVLDGAKISFPDGSSHNLSK